MADAGLIERLQELFGFVPRDELVWLADHGRLETWDKGIVVAPKGNRIDFFWIILSGHIAIRVDRGAGPRRIMEWRSGDIWGLLPYSRMKGPPGDSYSEEATRVLLIRQNDYPEMIRNCPTFTAHTVHIMLDRARTFNTADLQDEKMISLGKLAAGLAHELNNPASATLRAAKSLRGSLAEADKASRALGSAGLSPELLDLILRTDELCGERPASSKLSPIDRIDREDQIADWLQNHSLNPDHSALLAETAVTLETLDDLAQAAAPSKSLDVVVEWITTGCSIRSLAHDIERAATRIHELVAAIRNFTYMDRLAGPESVDIESGLRDTVLILASKAKSKNVTISVDVAPDLPRAYATGGELNQVWLNLIDNALDAVPESGEIAIRAFQELDRVVVSVLDNGSGIPPEITSNVFDPFFTTKPLGQGTGLGLDIVWRLLRRYHGDISFDSRPGRTEFRVSLLIEKSDPAS